MKIIGLVTTVFRDAKTLEVVREKTQENHIQEEYFKRLLRPNRGDQKTYNNIFLSSDNPVGQKTGWKNNEIGSARIGSGISGLPADKVTLDYSPGMHLREFVKRFAAPETDTDINMIGVCHSVSSGIVKYPDAVVWLSETVTQKTTEILDIFYRIQVTFDVVTAEENFVESTFSLSPGESRKIADAIVGEPTHNFNFFKTRSSRSRSYLCWHSLDKQPFRKFDFFKNQHTGNSNSGTSRKPDYDYSLMKSKALRNATTADFLGYAISWVGADYRSGSLMHLVKDPETDPVQSIFGHNSLSNTPFYNSVNSNLGLGKIEVNGTGWTNPDTGKYVLIDVVNDGLTGASTYKFRTQPFFGFVNNTWEPRECFLPFSTHTNRHISSGFAIGRDDYRHEPEVSGAFASSKRIAMSSFFKYKGGYEVLFLWQNEFAIIDVLTGEAVYPPFNNERLFDSALDPEFLAEDIIQHYVIGDFVYIACGVTGLYRIHPANDTIEKIDSGNTGLSGTAGCYGICEGFGGRLYAYFDHTATPTIYYSDDNGVSWISSGMVEPEFASTMKLLMGIQASKTEPDGHLAIIHRNVLPENSSTVHIRFSWYNLLTNTVTENVDTISYISDRVDGKVKNAYAEHNFNYSEAITCSPNQGKWAATSVGGHREGSTYFYTFEGSKSYLIGADLATYQVNNDWVVDKDGNDALLFITASRENGNESYGSGNVVVVTDGVNSEFYGLNHNSSIHSCIYLKDGLWLHANTDSSPTSTEENQSNGTHANYLTLFVGLPMDDTYASPDSTYGQMAYPIYGWNGSSWEAGHPDGKPTHAGHEELFDGVTMAWDDVGGTRQFLASDHYTTAIFNGIVMDGSTSFEFESTFYAKEVEELTDVESATLPVNQKISNIMLEQIPQGDVDFQDLDSMNTDEVSGYLIGTGNGLDDDYTGRARSANPAIQGDAVSFLPNKCFVPDSAFNNAIGWVEAGYYQTSTTNAQMYFGLSDSSVVGTVIDPSTIQYAIHIDSEPSNGGSPGFMRLTVVESGIGRATVEGIEYNTNKIPHFRIVLLNTGVMVYEFRRHDQPEWEELYRTPGVGLVPLVKYYLDVAAVPKSNYGLRDLKYGSLDPNNADYFVYLGNGVDSGLFDPEFRAIDIEHSKIYIGGQKAVIMDADMDTVLGPNRVSIFPYDGVMRYSADDAGKSLTASCLMVKL